MFTLLLLNWSSLGLTGLLYLYPFVCVWTCACTDTHTRNTYRVWHSLSLPFLFHAHWLLVQLLVLASLCLRALCGHEACPNLAQAGRKCRGINTFSFRSSLNLWVSGMVYKNHSFLILWRELVQSVFSAWLPRASHGMSAAHWANRLIICSLLITSLSALLLYLLTGVSPTFQISYLHLTHPCQALPLGNL